MPTQLSRIGSLADNTFAGRAQTGDRGAGTDEAGDATMLYYLVTRKGRHTMHEYFASWGRKYFWHIQPLAYETALAKRHHPPGTYIFADLERTTEHTRTRAAELWEQLNRPDEGYRLLNHPTQSLRRYDLLTKLADEGINQFRVHRLTETTVPGRFPVFLRREDDHHANQTGLLTDQAAVNQAVDQLRRRGEDLAPWIMAEFCDVSDADGMFTCYSSFCIDGTIFPHHLFFSRRWVMKAQHLFDPELLAQEQQYMATGAHQDELRRIFQLGRIDFGRIDYALLDGRIQVWEINTNSLITSPRHYLDPRRIEVYAQIHRGFAGALRSSLDDHPPRLADRLAHPLVRLRTVGGMIFQRLKATTPGMWVKRRAWKWFGIG